MYSQKMEGLQIATNHKWRKSWILINTHTIDSSSEIHPNITEKSDERKEDIMEQTQEGKLKKFA